MNMFKKRGFSPGEIARENDIKQNITKELSFSIQRLQQEHHNSDDPILSTESANTVCNVLEAVFLHGLKPSVSRKIAKYVGINQGSPNDGYCMNFWQLMDKFTHSDVISQLKRLGQVVTEVGLCRAWIRVALNDGLMGSYVDAMIADKKTLDYFYHRTAYLRDLEQPEILKSYLKGLMLLQFQLSYNSSVLNAWPNNSLVLAGIISADDTPLPVIHPNRDKLLGVSKDQDKLKESQRERTDAGFTPLHARGMRTKSRGNSLEEDSLSASHRKAAGKNKKKYSETLSSSSKHLEVSEYSAQLTRSDIEEIRGMKAHQQAISECSGSSRISHPDPVKYNISPSELIRKGEIEGEMFNAGDSESVNEFNGFSEINAVTFGSSNTTDDTSYNHTMSRDCPESRDTVKELRYSDNVNDSFHEDVVIKESKSCTDELLSDDLKDYLNQPVQLTIDNNQLCKSDDFESEFSTRNNVDRVDDDEMGIFKVHADKQVENNKISCDRKELESDDQINSEVFVHGSGKVCEIRNDCGNTENVRGDADSFSSHATKDNAPSHIPREFDQEENTRKLKEILSQEISDLENSYDSDIMKDKYSAENNGIEKSIKSLKRKERLKPSLSSTRKEMVQPDLSPAVAESILTTSGEYRISPPGLTNGLSSPQRPRSGAMSVSDFGDSVEVVSSPASVGNSLSGRDGWSSSFKMDAPEDILSSLRKTSASDTYLVGNRPKSESFGAILRNYAPSSTVASPTLEDIIQELPDTSSYTSPSQSNGRPRYLSTNQEDFEIVDASSVHAGNVNQYQFTHHQISLLGEIGTERGLDSQNYQCGSCKRPIGLIYGKPRVCTFDGCYYCFECHENQEYYIPAFIIHNWDFRKHCVSKKSLQFLQDVEDQTVIDISDINPRIYEHVREMNDVKFLRRQLFHLKTYVFTCKQSIADEFRKTLWPKEYLYGSVHTYTLNDLLQVPSGQFGQMLKKVIKFASKHVYNCPLCSGKGHICELCNSQKVIYPFEIENTTRCQKCKSVFHKMCKTDAKACPKCERRNKRLSLSQDQIQTPEIHDYAFSPLN